MKTNKYDTKPTSLPIIVTKDSAPGAALREFHCPNCGTEWIADWDNYEIIDIIKVFGTEGSVIIRKVKVQANCPKCCCETEGEFKDSTIKNYIPLYEQKLVEGE